LAVSPSGINREYSVKWSLSGSAYTNGHVGIKSSDKTKCVIDVLSETAFGDLKITATITTDKGTTVTATKNVIVGTTLTLNILSNQGTDSTISTVEATVTYGSTTNKIKNGGKIYIPINQLVKITYPNVTGYATPSAVEYTSTIEQKSVSATYNTTVVTVIMSDNQTSLDDITSAKATVKYDSTSTSLASGGSVKVPTGKSVTITWSSINGYKTPASQTFTATGTSAQYEGVYNTTIVTVKMADNQSSLNDIANATASVAASGMTTVSVKNNGTAKVPTGASCTITWSAVSGYKTPDKQTFTTSGTSVSKTGTYQTEILTVTVISDIDLPSNYTVTVSGIGSQTTASKVYKVPFGTSYTVSATAADGYSTPASQSFTANSASRSVTVEYLEYVGPPVDLSMQDIFGNPTSQTTANCYVVKEAGYYKFPLVYGNAIKNGAANSAAYTKVTGEYSHDFVNHLDAVITSPYIENHANCTAAGAELSLADTDNIFTNIGLENGNSCKYIRFKVNSIPSTGANGVVSVLDANGTVMWSWHIWIWSDDLTPVEITNNDGVKYNILPVNLATKKSTTAGKMYNWLYQWGRPTPMLPPKEYNSKLDADNYGVKTFSVSSAKADKYGIGIQNPQMFYKSSSSPYNWFGATSYYNLWDANCVSTGNSDNDVVKTVYDPCPAGFKMPNGNTFTYFSTSNVVGIFNNGLYFKRNAKDTTGVFFYASGCRTELNGALNLVGSSGYVWLSSAGSQESSYCLRFTSTVVNPQNTFDRAYGNSVRPVTDEAPMFPIENGVYIQAVDGTLYTESEWTAGGYANSDANGVAVISSDASFVIAKQDASSSMIRWGGYGKTVPNIVTSTSSATAILDYDGAGNTPKIIEYLAGTNDSYVDGAPAAEACAAFTFPNGKKGYLPALGEWKGAYNNKTAVVSAMSLIGGTAIKSDYYWSSTQHDSNLSWPLNWNSDNMYPLNKGSNRYVRAFAAL
jgi:hypothetical protein